MNSNLDKIHFLKRDNQWDAPVNALCYGHFSIIHPGHFRFLEYAASKGESLSVLLQGDNYFKRNELGHNFTEKDRALGLAALNYVHKIFVQSDIELEAAIEQLRPSILFLGREFENSNNEEFNRVIEIVKQNGGMVEYHAGETHYSTSSLRVNPEEIETERRFNAFKQACKRHNITGSRLLEVIDNFKEANIVVIGDTIIDQYIACDALGMSAEAPVVVLRELDQQDFLGGASIVAAHISAMGANCHYISVVGNDENGENLSSQLNDVGVSHDLIVDKTRPTTFKIRYMVENQKIFRVSRLKDHNLSAVIEDQVIDRLYKVAVEADGILISDFVYGCVTPKILNVVRQLAKKHDLKIFGDVQCSSQLGNILEFKEFNLITPTEREARISLGNKDDGIEVLANSLMSETLTKNMVLKLGGEGFITYMKNSNGSIFREHFPALVVNPIDVTGAGDSLLAALAVGLCSNANMFEAAAIGNCVASLSVSIIGNKPIMLDKIYDLIRKI